MRKKTYKGINQSKLSQEIKKIKNKKEKKEAPPLSPIVSALEFPVLP